MALTGPQKASIRMYFGYPARFHQTQPQLEQAFLALAQPGVEDDEAQVIALLNQLTTPVTGIEARLSDALDRLQASKVGSIELNKVEVAGLRNEGRRIVARMASIMGVTMLRDSFSGGALADNTFNQG